MILQRTLFAALFACCGTATAQQTLFKCVAPNGATSFRDVPCATTDRQQQMRAEAVGGQPDGSRQPSTAERQAAMLDAKVAEAIGSGDIPRAKGLALTADHWRMISEAENGRPTTTGRTRSDLRADARNSRECKEAQWSYDVDASSNRKDAAVIDASRRRMYSACGMDEPTQINNRTTIHNAPTTYRPR
jgi:hypothetical protein